MLRAGQIVGHQRKQACPLGQRVAEGERVVERLRFLDIGGVHRLGLRDEALQPQDGHQEIAGGDLLVELEADDMGAMHRRHVTAQHVLDLPPRRPLVAQEMGREAPHAFAGQRIHRVGRPGRHLAEPVGECQRLSKGAAIVGMAPQAPQDAQRIVGVVRAFRQSSEPRSGPLRAPDPRLRC